MEELAVEEQSLEVLREQLLAVQHIRRELERKDDQIASLKLKLTETASFRDQAISLRTQCKILEEKVNHAVSGSSSRFSLSAIGTMVFPSPLQS